MATKKPTQGERVAVLEEKVSDNERDIGVVCTKVDAVVMQVATFETSFKHFLNNGLPQRIGDHLAEKGRDRNRQWRFALLVLGTAVTLGSLIVAGVAVSRMSGG